LAQPLRRLGLSYIELGNNLGETKMAALVAVAVLKPFFSATFFSMYKYYEVALFVFIYGTRFYILFQALSTAFTVIL
jgi:hypothetical protein